MSLAVRIVDAAAARARADGLTDVLLDCVEGGASVSFMWPMARTEADRFWAGVIAGVAAGERVLIVAEEDGVVLGTVQVVLAQPPNQPHRGDISKMLVHRAARRRGLGALLMAAAEDAAKAAGKTLLVLDTASADAERLYERSGWTRVGVIPNYALNPDGTLCDTTYFYKAVG